MTIPPEEPPFAEDLKFASELFRVSRLWALRLDERLKRAGPGRAVWATLLWLSQRPGGMAQHELADEIGVERPTLTRQLDNMERMGLIERRPSPGDRRAKRVVLTDAASLALERMDAQASDMRRELLQDVEPQDLAAAVRVLKAVRQRLGARDDRPLP